MPPMAKTLEQILGYVYLTGLVEDIKTGIPKVLPEAFWNVKGETLYDQGRYTRYSGTRRTARRVEYGSPAHRRKLSDIGSFDVKLLHLYEHIELDVKTYQSLRAYTDYAVQNMGQQEVDRQALQFRTLFDNTRLSSVHSMLATGAIYYDSDGYLLPTSSGASLTVDYGIAANNKNQLNGIIAASWATSTTDIPGQLRALKKRSVGLTGYPLKYAFYGQNIPSYMTQNVYVKDFLARHPAMREKYLDSAEIPNGLFGFEWVPVYDAFYEDSSGTNQFWFDSDTVVFAPEIDKSVYELMEGTYPVPTSFQPMQTLQNAVGSFSVQRGMFSYATPIANPMTAQIFAGDTFLPIWKIPDTLFIADTTP